MVVVSNICNTLTMFAFLAADNIALMSSGVTGVYSQAIREDQ